MASDPRIAALPAVAALATNEARAEYEAYAHAYHARYPNETLRPWGSHDGDHGCFIAAQLALLSDLSRPASRDAVARLVAEAVGLECGATAPGLFLLTDPEPVWWLDCITGDDEKDADARCAFHDSPRVAMQTFLTQRVAGISAVTDPADALALIAIHILGVAHE